MTQKDISKWIMYYEIHKLERLGFSTAKIARYLAVDPRTVSKYLHLTEDGYELSLLNLQERNKALARYETFVKEKLEQFTETSTAQIHDWLKERYPDIPKVSPKTVYNFVMYVRQKHNIPIETISREYFPVEDLPYGQQAQVDFGEYNMRSENGKRKKVWFFAMVLSRSRMKHICFSDKPFTSATVCQAHEHAFAFFNGIPKTLVYDQDRTLIVDENMGDVILTSTFKRYTQSRNFELHFCRKADPESKGKVENVIQYVKKNFLYNRLYSDIETLNQEAVGWLGRTANYLPHNYTKKTPESEYLIEKKYLSGYTPMTIENKEVRRYHVRKTNTIAFKSNFYTVPMGTYKGPDSIVVIKDNNGVLEIYDSRNVLIATHKICTLQGQTIRNTDHKRDTSRSLDEMKHLTARCFNDTDAAMRYLEKIRQRLPRYSRDHYQVILKSLHEVQKDIADKALQFCVKNSNYNGHEFREILQVYLHEATVAHTPREIKLLNVNSHEKANETPQTSSIQDYEDIINQQKICNDNNHTNH